MTEDEDLDLTLSNGSSAKLISPLLPARKSGKTWPVR